MSFKRKRERQALASLIIPRDSDLPSDSPTSGPRSGNSRHGSPSKPRIYETPVLSEDIQSLSQICDLQSASEAAKYLTKEQYWKWVHKSNPFRAGKQSRFCDSTISLDVEAKKAEYFVDGFVEIDSYSPILESLIDSIVKGIYKLKVKGFPPTFFLLFDECWEIIQMFSSTMRSISENKYCNFDILAWVIDPSIGSAAGFSPHRDRQPDDVKGSFNENDFPKYCTCWLALTEATTDNSCLYMIPKWADPGYAVLEGDDVDPMREALKDKHDFQSIKAFPLAQGNSVVFSHRILHWGSKASKTKSLPPQPRVSMAFAFSDETFEKPYLNVEHLPLPPFHLRIALACAQMIIYYQRFECNAQQLLVFKTCFEENEQHFEAEYKRKVRFEYARAILELEKGLSIKRVVEESSNIDDQRIDSDLVRLKKSKICHSNAAENDDCQQSDDADDDADGGFAFGVDEDEDAVEAALDEMIDNEDAFSDDYEDDDE